MIGVTTYPYTIPQNMYRSDFETLVASTITHPFISMTTFNKGSAPHNILTGSAFAPTYDYFKSDAQRSWVFKSYKESFNTKASGLRSEQVRFVS